MPSTVIRWSWADDGRCRARYARPNRSESHRGIRQHALAAGGIRGGSVGDVVARKAATGGLGLELGVT